MVCLGDYMYEYSDANDPDSGIVRRDTTGRNSDGDVQFIDEYRQKYRLYKSDPGLKAMHAKHPFISVWDDHEIEDNHADGSPSSAQKDPNKTNLKNLPRRVPYLTRRMNGYQAFFNYMPRTRFKASSKGFLGAPRPTSPAGRSSARPRRTGSCARSRVRRRPGRCGARR